jgi:ATP-dependent helicase/nuclease subunit B
MNKNSIQLLDQGYTLVTAGQRLARYFQHAYARLQLDRGRRAWPAPDILPWQTWLQRCWDEHAIDHRSLLLLNSYQEQVLWQKVIAESPWADGLLQPANVAQRVMEAWDLLRQFQMEIFPSGTFINEDARAFKSWADGFQRICRERDWCDTSSMIDVLVQSAGAGHATTGNIALAGFEHITPQQHALFASMEAVGCRFITVVPETGNGAIAAVAPCADAVAEMRAAANWAGALLQEDADRHIGIIVPDLHGCRSEIVQQFEDCLSPGLMVGVDPGGTVPFTLSLGRPLSDYPLIDTALSLLSLAGGTVPAAELGSLLRSPYLAGAQEEAAQRGWLDSRLREFSETRSDIRSLIRVATRQPEEGRRPQQFLEALSRVSDFRQQLPRQAAPDDWAVHFTGLLKLFGWPGDRGLDSNEYQVLESWRECLARLVSLQLVDVRLDFSTALDRLRRLATGFSFQPATAEAPIQILGLTGAADMGFDHLWVMGLHEEVWPPSARPNPFIPLDLQRRHAMPGATAELCLAQARETLARLLASAGETVFSFPLNERDRGLRPSPLLKPYLESGRAPDIAHPPDYLARIVASGTLETFSDANAPPLPGGSYSAGGTGLFRDQSACPFRAFARYRLHAAALEQADIGLSPRDRGLILHSLLHRLWQRLGSLEQLQAMDGPALEQLLVEVTTETIESGRRRHPGIWTHRFTALEQARLQGILRDWLEQERRRTPFRVLACEMEQPVSIEDIEVQTRIDRIDSLPDGGEVIIDYKSGAAGISDWLGERPDDPQLPLYAVARKTDVAAIAFASLKRGKGFGFHGLARAADILPDTPEFAATPVAGQMAGAGAAPSWEALLTGWREALAGLAREFRAGDARVAPKRPDTCRYCDQHPLCRIYETQIVIETQTDGDDDD